MSVVHDSCDARHARTPPKPISATPAIASATCIARLPMAFLAAAVPLARNEPHVRLPRPTPNTSSAGDPAAPAVLAAANTAAHDAIVNGFDAVPASDSLKAARGSVTSDAPSLPLRILNAVHS